MVKTSKITFAFVRGVVDSVASTDVKISDYLTRFFDSVVVLGYFDDKSNIIKKAKPNKIYFKPVRIPFIQGFIISLISFIKLVKIKPNIVLWNWLYFFPGGLLLKLTCPYIKVFIDIRSHPISERFKFKTAVYNALFVWILKKFGAFVDGFTIISSSMLTYITKRFGVRLHKKVCIWPSGFDKESFDSIRKLGYKYLNYLREILGIKESHKVLVYYGSIAYSRLPLFRLLIETIDLLKKDHQDIKLLIVGKGDAVSEVKKLIHSHNLKEHVLLVPAISHSMIPLILMISDVVITPFPRDHDWLTQVPLKIIEALGMEKLVITTPLIELKRILPPEYLIDFDELSPVTLKNRVETLLYDDAQKNIKYNINVTDLSWDTIAEKLYKCIIE